MTRPITPAEVEAEMRRIARRLEDRTDALAGLLESAAEADVACRLAFPRQLLVAEGSTVAEREAAATLAVASELRARKTTEAVADAFRRRALLRSGGDTVGEREAEAILSVADLFRGRRLSEAVADACRESVRSLREQLGACRSLNANVREHAGLA
jgi:hypothetical protein